MANIYLLDCTLRDGGYVNNWDFGNDNIQNIITGLERAGVNIIELGFLRDEIENINRTIFSSIEVANRRIKRKDGIMYSAMIEAFNPYPLEKLSSYDKQSIDLVRVCIWKRCMSEHMKYCKEVVDKGYKITIQPSRVEQYSQSEFIDMIKRANELHPYAVYVVDTWGTQSSKQICRYLELADKYLEKDIKVGYHGHNNKLQALSCVQAALEMGLSRDICIDSSIMGMGRGAGNLNTEVVIDYLNERYKTKYNTNEIIETFNKYLSNTYKKVPWGYSMYYYLSAIYNCNPNFATYFLDNGYSERTFELLLREMSKQEKVVFNADWVEKKLGQLKLN